jgi:alkylation response protein AidB-like acyl-CoA dehydrogenase
MRWRVEDTPERAEFRAEFKKWLVEVLPDGWVEALAAKDDAAFAEARKNFNFLSWMGTIGRSGYAAPMWPKEYGATGRPRGALQPPPADVRRQSARCRAGGTDDHRACQRGPEDALSASDPLG